MTITANHANAIPLAYWYEDVSQITSRSKMSAAIQVTLIKLQGHVNEDIFSQTLACLEFCTIKETV